jgi:methionine-rich copper-binding protein CopC
MKVWSRRVRGGRLAVVAALVLAVLPLAGSAQAASDPCGSGSNPIVCENSKPGSPKTDWFSPNAYGDIKGFTTKESVQAGDTLQFKVQSKVPYHIEIYRLGWYGGNGAREISTAAQAAVTYPANFTSSPASCTTKASTGLVDCGNWPVTANWTVPSDAVSGLYIANLDQADGNGLMPYPFVVRNDSSTSAMVVQTSDETWQAYNTYGGQNLYGGGGPAPDGRAYEVSYNRPLDIGGDNGIYGSEYEMLSWLERNGYDVSYTSGVQVSGTGGAALLEKHKVYMSSGHDEYWTQSQYSNVLAARKAGVREAFFSGNEVFWKTRFTPSIDGANTPNRTLVCYKMTKMAQNNGVADPSGIWTGTWMDPTSTNYGQSYQPENVLTGSMFTVNGYRSDAITVPGSYGKNRIWRNTSIANLTSGQTATFPTGTLGYEWDSDIANSTRPAGAIDVSSTTVDVNDGKLRQDWGNTYGNGTATHNLVEFRDQDSGALVFGSGTVQWSWGLANVPTADPANTVVTEDSRMQQATVNILADMGVQPLTLQGNLVGASASTDTTGPAITVTSPASGVTVPALKPVTVKGTAADSGGVVARVEVSTDGGTTWNAATGLTSWSYTWTPTTPGSASIQVRAVDDSANIGAVTTIPLTVGPQACPCTIWPASAVPGTVNGGDGGSVELGVKFRTTVAGSITAVRFYKSPVNTGTHVGNLWTASGTRLATGTFTGETASGWQQLNFATPVTVKANTTYVASYFAPNGGYSFDNNLANSGAGLAPLTALQSGVDGGNGVYRYTSTSAFPSSQSSGSNYWVDVVLDTSTASTTPPTVTSTSPTSGATSASITAPVSATFSAAVDPDTVTFTVKDAGGNTVPGSVTYPASNKATFTPSTELELSSTYTASVQASDVWGNAMANPVTWSFTTSSTPPAVTCPCTLWSSSAVPASTDTTGDTNSVELGTRFTSSAAGWVTGVTFYKGTGNTGTHTGSLWGNDGTLLATGTFTGETASGWQTLTFASPVAITADTPYVVSYHAPNGNYAVDGGYFAAAHKSYPLTAPADTTASHNGLYRYGTDSGFPTGSYGSANYWVGPVFTADNPSTMLSTATSSEVTASSVVHTADAASPVVMTLPATTKLSSVKATVTVLSGSNAARKLHVTAVTSYDRATHKVTVHLSSPLPDGTRFEITVTAKDKHRTTVKSHSWTLTSKSVRKKKN